MESLRFVVALKVHCSKQCKEILDRLGGYHLQERGLVEMKVHSLDYAYWHECFVLYRHSITYWVTITVTLNRVVAVSSQKCHHA